ncbi:MAG: M15 family metallopeptidase [Bacteroidota bacterium]
MMAQNTITRKGKISQLAEELSSRPGRRARKGKVKRGHYDQGQSIQLSYNTAAHQQFRPTAYANSFDVSGIGEVRSFEASDDRFYVESFDAHQDQEIVQFSNLNQQIEMSSASSHAFNAPDEIIQQSTLNQEIDGVHAGSMALNATGEEIVLHNTLNEEIEGAPAASMAYAKNNYDDATYEENYSAPSHEDESSGYSAAQSSFEDDIKAILAGQKKYDIQSKSMTSAQEAEPESDQQSPLTPPPSGHSHEVFNRMAKGMSKANSYDLGTLSLENSFNEFDKLIDRNKPVEKKFALASNAFQRENEAQALSDLDYAEDLSAIAFDNPPAETGTSAPPVEGQANMKQNVAAPQTETSPVETAQPVSNAAITTPETGATQTPSIMPVEKSQQTSHVSYAYDDRTGPNWPPRPANINIMTQADKERIFGRFEYEPTTGDDIRILGTWVNDNIVNIRIPQLDGKIFGGRPFAAGQGSIRFHRLAQNKLVQLWAAWERAGLLDRILSFQGGFVPRFIRGTAGRNPRPLSNHAWGTAFDINAPQNGFGAEPALLGATGCVRELVEIANQHGFFWGGHFRRKDGMHFEIASPFNP